MQIRNYTIGLLLVLLCCTGATAQSLAEKYRSNANPYYWKNRMPDAAYWQQDVAYTIKATIHEQDNSIEGTEALQYFNNSPDTLYYVYFHLYQNAFINGSYLHQLELLNKVKPEMGEKERVGLGIMVNNVKVNGTAATTVIDNTLLKVILPDPLPPGKSLNFTMEFNTYYDKGETRRRMKMYDAWGFMHYNGCQWYPKISVYDRMHGWDVYQHLNKEFYGDFGSFDVTLNFASNYVVEATGELQNRSEMLPDTLRKKLDVTNFAKKPWNEPPSTITPYTQGERKSWHFAALNVHDFAFTADPSFRISTSYYDGIECVGIVQEPHASGWQNSSEYVATIIKTFSNTIGRYCYPKIVAADAEDGMEYPMITLDGGSNPGYHGLLVHEIGHNWFYGQVGSNETYRAAMDEGFTQYLTSLGMRLIDGDTIKSPKVKNPLKRLQYENSYIMDRNVHNSYTLSALRQNEVSINTHSDDFHNALNHGGGYGAVYYKTATMLYNLEYVLGDTLFKNALHHYFEQWKFAHPYFEDFRASIIQYTHADLDWFFDQWFETTKTIDYSIGHIKRIKGTDSFAITLKRKSDMQMPIDLSVWDKAGVKHNYYIPNTWFEKQTDATKLHKWYGWGHFNPTYTAHIAMPAGIKRVQIDTTYRLADRVLSDNYKTKGGILRNKSIMLKPEIGQALPVDRRHYRLYHRPDVWWNPIDGTKVGWHIEGDYLYSLNRLDATVWWNSHTGQGDEFLSPKSEKVYDRYAPVNYTFTYTSYISRRLPKLTATVHSRFLDGLWYHKAGLTHEVNDNNYLYINFTAMWRPNARSLDYLTEPGNWSSNSLQPNNSLNAQWQHTYNSFQGAGNIIFSLRTPALAGNNNPFNYSYLQMEAKHYWQISDIFLRSRVFGRWGMGNNIPAESALYLAGGSPEDQMENKYTRSKAFIPYQWQGTSLYDVNHYQATGGLGLRGYAGYYAPDSRNGEVLTGYKGRSGAAINIEADFDGLISLHPKLTRNWLHVDLYGFADAGIMELSRYTGSNIYALSPTAMMSDIRIDAGLGAAFNINKLPFYGPKMRPITLRIDFPLFINRTPYNHPSYTALRYVVGINRAF